MNNGVFLLDGRLNGFAKPTKGQVLDLFPSLLEHCINTGEVIEKMVEVSSNEPGSFGFGAYSVHHMLEEGIVLFTSLGSPTLERVPIEGSALDPLVPILKTSYMTPLVRLDGIRPVMHQVSAGYTGEKTDSSFFASNCEV